MRASLLASAVASLLRCRRGCAAFSQAPKLNRSQVCGRMRMTLAAWMKSVRRYLLPRLEMRPRIDLPPVLYWRGTSPSQAPNHVGAFLLPKLLDGDQNPIPAL